jgi:hypothetical protein
MPLPGGGAGLGAPPAIDPLSGVLNAERFALINGKTPLAPPPPSVTTNVTVNVPPTTTPPEVRKPLEADLNGDAYFEAVFDREERPLISGDGSQSIDRSSLIKHVVAMYRRRFHSPPSHENLLIIRDIVKNSTLEDALVNVAAWCITRDARAIASSIREEEEDDDDDDDSDSDSSDEIDD